jgi:citrate lyase subunit beta/citryl-CoA lyase
VLFTPGTRPDRFASAQATGADLLVLDLEDSVAAVDKDTARDNVEAWLSGGHPALVRINGYGTAWHEADLAMVASQRCSVMLPKADTAEIVAGVRASIGSGVALVALIETALGVLNAREICAGGAITRACFGSVDLATELGIAHADGAALTHARVSLVLACAAAQLPGPLDGVTTSLGDAAALASDIGHSRKLGFTGKLAIHPRQVPAINGGYSPSDDEQRWARAILDVADGAGVASIDGHMIDRPVLERARRLLSHESPTTAGDTQ